MHTRSGVDRKPAVQPAQPRRGQALQRASSATLNKDRTWPTTKQLLHRDSNPVASAHCHGGANFRLSSKWSPRLVTVRDCDLGALRQAILSGFPTITTSSFSHCPISGLSPFVVAHHRRTRQIPLPRDDIPHIARLTSSIPPPGADVIPKFDQVFAQECGAVWRMQGEYLFGGTGTSIRQEGRFDRM